MNNTTEIIQKLEQGVKDALQSGHYKTYLTTMARFHRYSYSNCILILIQNPNATRVAGVGTWNSMGRFVNKGEHGIEILAPIIQKIKPETPNEKGRSILKGYRVVRVFDVSQTSGQELPSLATELHGRVADFETLKVAISQVAGCPVSFEKITGGGKGFYQPGQHRIVVSENLSEIHSIKTLLHELAHSRLHRRTASQVNHDIKDRSTREVEAESVAFVVCQHLGFDTSDYSFDYVANWSSDEQIKELKAALPLIQKTANEIIEELDQVLNPAGQAAA